MTQSIEAESVVHSNPNISGGTPRLSGYAGAGPVALRLPGRRRNHRRVSQAIPVGVEGTGTRGAESGARLRSDPCAFCLTKPAACSGGGTDRPRGQQRKGRGFGRHGERSVASAGQRALRRAAEHGPRSGTPAEPKRPRPADSDHPGAIEPHGRPTATGQQHSTAVPLGPYENGPGTPCAGMMGLVKPTENTGGPSPWPTMIPYSRRYSSSYRDMSSRASHASTSRVGCRGA